MNGIFVTAGIRSRWSLEQVVGHRSQWFYRVFPGLLNRLSHSIRTNSQSLPDLNTGSQTKSLPLQAPRVADLSIAMKTCSSSNMAAGRNSAAFMVHCPVSQSNLRPVFEPPPPPPVLPQSEHMDSHPRLQKWQTILFVCFICGSKLGPQFRCTPSIYHVNTLFISLFIYLFIYLAYLLDTCWFVDYHVFIYCF